MHVGKQHGTGMKSLTTNLPAGLLLDQPQDVGDRDPLHRVVAGMAAGVERRLKVDPANRRMRDREIDDATELVLVDAAFDRRHQRDVQPRRGQAVQGADALLDDVGFAAQRERRSALEPVELKVERRLDLGELLDELVVARNPLAVGVDHDEADAARLRGLHEVDDLRMNRRLAAGELHDLGHALRSARSRRASLRLPRASG